MNEETIVDEELIQEFLENNNFVIVNAYQDPETNYTILEVLHQDHPDNNVKITLVTKTEEDEELSYLEFEGDDTWTEEEAKILLNDVMDLLVEAVKSTFPSEEKGSGSGSSSVSESSSESSTEGGSNSGSSSN
jgi:hypothetical protein